MKYFDNIGLEFIKNVVLGNDYLSNVSLGRMQGYAEAQEFDKYIELNNCITDIINLAYDIKDELIDKGIY